MRISDWSSDVCSSDLKIANELFDDIIAKHGPQGEFGWAHEFTALYPVTVIAEVLGGPSQRSCEFKYWVDDILSAANRNAYGPDKLAKIGESSRKTREFFEALYDERAANLGQDMISTLIQAEVDGQKLSRNQVLSMAILLLIGGVETTTNLIGTTLVELKRHPEPDAAVLPNTVLMVRRPGKGLGSIRPCQIIFRHTPVDTGILAVKTPPGFAAMQIEGAPF